MKYRISFICALCIITLLGGCYNDAVLPEGPGEIPLDVSFSQDIIPIFNASCNVAGCHNAGGIPPDLTAANAFSSLNNGGYINTSDPANSKLYQRMASDMPPSGINAGDNALVLAWIEQGALDN